MVFDPDIFNNYLNNYWFQSSIFFYGVYKASTIFACSTYKQDDRFTYSKQFDLLVYYQHTRKGRKVKIVIIV